MYKNNAFRQHNELRDNLLLRNTLGTFAARDHENKMLTAAMR